MRSHFRRAIVRVGSLGVALFLSACTLTENPTSIDEAESIEPPAKYTLTPGDEIEVQFFHTPELNVIAPVRPDGYISLPFAYEIQAAGLTPERLRQELLLRYETELRDPEIAVIVRSFTNNQVHVGGEVDKPGIVPLVGPLTVFQAIFAAGGQLDSARMDEVLLIRQREDRTFMVIPLNLEAVIDGTDTRQNVSLRPLDIVFIPKSPIGNVNKWVDLYVRKNIPINFGLRPDVPF